MRVDVMSLTYVGHRASHVVAVFQDGIAGLDVLERDLVAERYRVKRFELDRLVGFHDPARHLLAGLDALDHHNANRVGLVVDNEMCRHSVFSLMFAVDVTTWLRAGLPVAGRRHARTSAEPARMSLEQAPGPLANLALPARVIRPEAGAERGGVGLIEGHSLLGQPAFEFGVKRLGICSLQAYELGGVALDNILHLGGYSVPELQVGDQIEAGPD